MSRRRGPRSTGMRPAANAAHERLVVAHFTNSIKERVV